MQALVLLTLIAFPGPVGHGKDSEKPKKKKNPERHSSTLNPELLLDFLTDRLQIWRVMRDVDDLRLEKIDKSAIATLEPEFDEVQQWWQDVVEAR